MGDFLCVMLVLCEFSVPTLKTLVPTIYFVSCAGCHPALHSPLFVKKLRFLHS